MTKPTSEEEISFFSKPTSKEDFLVWSFAWSYFVSLALVLLSTWLETNELPTGRGVILVVLSALVPAVIFFVYWQFVRWVALTAEKAGRPFVGFMVFAIFMPILAGIVVIMFKRED